MEPVSKGGFTRNVTTVEGVNEYQGNTLRVSALNENYAVQTIDRVHGTVKDTLATIPDVIAIVNLETSKLHSIAVGCTPLNVACITVEGRTCFPIIGGPSPQYFWFRHLIQI